MASLNPVPSEDADEGQLEWTFEGLPVQHTRADPGSPGEFPCIDEDGSPLTLKEGDVFAYQAEAIVTSVEIGAGYKGGIQVKARKRVHHGRTIDGSQQIVGVVRRK